MIGFKEIGKLISDRINLGLPGQSAQRIMSALPNAEYRFSPMVKENARHSGVLILLYPENNNWWFPMILRHDYGGVHSAQVSLPGGRKEPEDQDIIETALRETHEEIGVPSGNLHVLGQLSELYIPVSNHLVFPTVAICDFLPEFIKEEREVDRILHASLSQLLDPEYSKRTEIEVKGFKLNAPYFDFDNEIVWGATAMILSEFKQILKEVGNFH